MTAAESRYNGVRVTLTNSPGADFSYVNVSVKDRHGHWADWSLLFPAIRESHQPMANVRDALTVALAAIERVRDEL